MSVQLWTYIIVGLTFALYIFIAIKITIYILQIAGWKFALALFLIFWNIYLKRLWYVYFAYPVFGIRQLSDGLSEDEIWHFHTKTQSRIKYWFWDSLALPYLLFNLVYFILFYLI